MTDMNDTFIYSNDLRQTYGKYTKQSFKIWEGEFFKSGRQKYIATFISSDNGSTYKHEAMQLTSNKTGKPYYKVHKLTLDMQAHKRKVNTSNDKRSAEQDDEPTDNILISKISNPREYSKEYGDRMVELSHEVEAAYNNAKSSGKTDEEAKAEARKVLVEGTEKIELGSMKPEPLTYQTRDFKQGHVEHE